MKIKTGEKLRNLENTVKCTLFFQMNPFFVKHALQVQDCFWVPSWCPHFLQYGLFESPWSLISRNVFSFQIGSYFPCQKINLPILVNVQRPRRNEVERWFLTFLIDLFVSKWLENAQGACPHHSESNYVYRFLIIFSKQDCITLGVAHLTFLLC